MKQRLIVVATIVGLAMVFANLGHTPTARADDPNNWSKTGNAGTIAGTNFVGTTDNVALELKVNNIRALRLEPTTGTPNLIGGDSTNTALAGVVGATIGGGGGGVFAENQVFDNFGTIGGGTLNRAGVSNAQLANEGFATVGGGNNNVASGFAAAISGGASNIAGSTYSAVGGGYVNTASGDRSAIGGGASNTASGSAATVGGGDTNAASGFNSAILGGSDNVASGSGSFIGGGHGSLASNYRTTVSGGEGNTAAGDSATVAGGFGNLASDNGDTVGGGSGNQAGDNAGLSTGRPAATVAGGDNNTASGAYSTIAGGRTNTASGTYADVAGGYLNSASGIGATVGGGDSNTASAAYATSAGGRDNIASGNYSTVPGGFSNVALGVRSFAAGTRALANHSGAFVWGDSTNADVASTANNQFIARASGGVTFYSNAAATAGVRLLPGSGGWSTLSDRNTKANFATVDSSSILAKVAAMPIQLWNYKSQGASVKHIGPMAQDFAAAFGVGENTTTINTVDADGIALAAIQGLNLENQALKARLTTLEQATPATGNWLPVVLALGGLNLLLMLALMLSLVRRRTA